MEEGRSAFKMLIGKPTGKRPLGRLRRRWEDNIRIYFKKIGIDTRNWVDSAQDRDYWRSLVNTALNLRVPKAMELYCIVLKRWSLLPNALRPFQDQLCSIMKLVSVQKRQSYTLKILNNNFFRSL